MVHNNENAIILKPAFVQKTEPPGSSIEKKKARLIFTPQSLLTKFTKYLQKNCKHLQFIFKKQLKEINSSIIKLYRDITLQFTLRKNRVLKKDKNIDDQNRYFTLMIVPHSSSKVKTFKLSRSVVKFGIIFMVLIVTSSVYISIYISGIIAENNTLKSSMDSLYTIVNKQEADLNKKLAAIDTLIEKQNSANVDLAEYSNKFREIVDDYVTGRISSGITSRSSSTSASAITKDIKEMTEILNAISELNTQKEDNLLDLSELEAKLSNYLDSLPTLWPVSGDITSRYGYRLDPITFRRAFHSGIDIAASYGVGIKASAAGKVILTGYYKELGQTVIIDHGNGIKTVYGHTSKILVKNGQTVKKGEVIAKVGTSGRTTGAHLHFEVLINGVQIDPCKYLE